MSEPESIINNQAHSAPNSNKNRFILIGGFLGAGKTTAMNYLAKSFQSLGLRTGLITNDQGSNLADTKILKSAGHTVSEIPNGCFCCKFTSLQEAANNLTQQNKPDIFLAEPVGSCTDLVAGVSYPLRRIYQDQFTIAPFLVLIDPIRAMRIFGLKKDKQFSDEVRYIFEQQLLEADIIGITKTDITQSDDLQAIQKELETRFENKTIIQLSFNSGENTADVIELLLNNETKNYKLKNIDYDIYAKGEAKLGWVNLSVEINQALFQSNPFDFLSSIHKNITAILDENKFELAHLKSSLDSGSEVIYMQQTSNEESPTYISKSLKNFEPIELTINCRFEGLAMQIKDKVLGIFSDLESCNITHQEFFQPILNGKPAQAKDTPLDPDIFCTCSYTQLLKESVVKEKLKEYISNNQKLQIIPDLCYLAAKEPETLREIAKKNPAKLIACYPRALKGIFELADAKLSDAVEVVNLREASKEPK